MNLIHYDKLSAGIFDLFTPFMLINGIIHFFILKVDALKGYIVEAKNGTRNELQLVNFDNVSTVD